MAVVAEGVLEGGESMSTSDETIDGRQPDSTFADRFFSSEPATTPVRLAAVSHVGNVRKNNEDHFIVVRRSRSREVLHTNLPTNPGPFPPDYAYTLIVADGVGGAAFGEIASQLALETAMELVGHATTWVDAGGRDNVTLILCDVIDESEEGLCDTQTRPGNEARGR